MIAEDNLQSFLQKMRAGMILLSIKTSVLVDCKMSVIPDLYNTVCDNANVSNLAAADRLCIFYLELAFRSTDDALVTDLTAHSSVERGFFGDDRALVTLCEGHDRFAGVIISNLCREDYDLGVIFGAVITRELR